MSTDRSPLRRHERGQLASGGPWGDARGRTALGRGMAAIECDGTGKRAEPADRVGPSVGFSESTFRRAAGQGARRRRRAPWLDFVGGALKLPAEDALLRRRDHCLRDADPAYIERASPRCSVFRRAPRRVPGDRRPRTAAGRLAISGSSGGAAHRAFRVHAKATLPVAESGPIPALQCSAMMRAAVSWTSALAGDDARSVTIHVVRAQR